jgi:hypothetical protein
VYIDNNKKKAIKHRPTQQVRAEVLSMDALVHAEAEAQEGAEGAI